MNNYFKNFQYKVVLLLSILLTCISVTAFAGKSGYVSALKNVKFVSLPDNKVRISLHFSKPLKHNPQSFTTTTPRRIMFDIANVENDLSNDQTQQIIDQGVLHKFLALNSGNRVRLVLEVSEIVKYKTRLTGKKLDIILSGGAVNNRHMSTQRFGMPMDRYQHRITKVDFKALKNKGGKVIISLSDDGVPVDLQQENSALYVTFPNTYLPQSLMERLDVGDFGSPVRRIDASRRGSAAKFVVRLRGDREHFAYQVDKQFVIEVIPTIVENGKKLKKDGYNGKRVSMHFQDIKVRAALQLLADISKRNIVISDTVQGNITLRLNRVPWDQALEIILKTRGLAKREYGKVIIVAPTKEIAAQEKQELLSRQDVQKLAPLTQELLQINYAKASDIAALLKDKNNSLLSQRGNVSVDERTNTLWIQDTSQKIAQVHQLVTKLDRPVQQVLIETRIVIVDKDFEKDLGVRFGVSRPNHFTGTLDGANSLASNTSIEGVAIENRLNIDLPSAPDNAASIGLALARLSNGTLLDLELSALETEGVGEIISTPRVITANQQEALIESGEEIPYQESTSSGATSIAFKKAVLSLRVKPQITPDNKLVLDLTVNQDTVGSRVVNNVPAIETKEIQTKVLVDNGETIVLGGIYKQTKQEIIERVPFLGKIPVIGVLFKRRVAKDNRDELLIFVTPKIVRKKYTGYHS